MRNLIGDQEIILVVLSFFIGWMPEGRCDHVHRTMPVTHYQYAAQTVEPAACRALPKPSGEQRRER